MSEISENWSTGKLGDLLDYIQPTKFIVKSTEYSDEFKTPVLTAGKSFIKGYTDETDAIFDERPVIIFDDFTTATKFVNFPFKVKSSAMKILKPRNEEVNMKYVFYFMQTLRENTDTHKRYWISIFSKLPIPIAPLPEQRRIVARIEELFSRLDAGVAALRHAKAQLQRYRQSVLAAAVTGQLTQAWREQHPDTEPASELLDRILEQRREQWNGRGNYKEPAITEQSLPYSLPDSWANASFDQISSQVTVGHVGSMKDKYKETGIPFLRSQNVRPMRFAPENLVYIDADFDAGLAKSRLYGGEILLTRSGANVGQCCVYPKSHGNANCSDLVITRPLAEINAQFGALFMNSPQGRRLLHLNKVGNAQAHFNVGSMKVAPLALPPLAEQHQIVAEVESRTTAIDHLEAELDRQLVRSSKLRSSVLSAAFAGKLL